MKHRPRPPEQDDLLRPRLVDMIDARLELVRDLGKPVVLLSNAPRRAHIAQSHLLARD